MSIGKIIIAGCLMAFGAMPVGAQTLDGTLKKIKETGSITIGYRESSVPFSFLDDTQKPVGFAIDICGHIVDAVKTTLKLDKLDVKYNPVTSATRIPLVANGTVDLECGSTTNNVDRQKQASFTNTDFLSATLYLAKKASNLKTIDDLRGKTVVSTSGTTNIKMLNEINTKRGLGMTIIPAKDHAEAFLMVETDRASAFVMDDILLAGFKARSKNPDVYAISPDAFSKAEPYSIILRRGDPAFKAVVDKATADLYKSPAMAALYDKWFMQPINASGLNLKYPMTPDLKKAFANPSDSADPASYTN